jgi:hypothetical protein
VNDCVCDDESMRQPRDRRSTLPANLVATPLRPLTVVELRLGRHMSLFYLLVILPPEHLPSCQFPIPLYASSSATHLELFRS